MWHCLWGVRQPDTVQAVSDSLTCNQWTERIIIHIESYYKAPLLHGGLFVVFRHDFEVLFIPSNLIFYTKQHNHFTCSVTMCLFEPAFIQFGQYIKSSLLFISNRWNIPLKRGSLYRTALYIFRKLYKSRFKLVHIYCTIEVIVLFHESKTGHSQSQVWTIFKVKNKSFLVKKVDTDYVQKVDHDCVQSFFLHLLQCTLWGGPLTS